MAQDTKTYWVLGDGEGYVGTVIRNGVHLITVEESPSKVKVARVGKTKRHISRRAWDAIPKVLCTGQSLSDALCELRLVGKSLPKRRARR